MNRAEYLLVRGPVHGNHHGAQRRGGTIRDEEPGKGRKGFHSLRIDLFVREAAQVVTGGRVFKPSVPVRVQRESSHRDDSRDVLRGEEPRGQKGRQRSREVLLAPRKPPRPRFQAEKSRGLDELRSVRGDEDALASHAPEAHERKDLPDGRQRGADLVGANVMQLDPLLEDATSAQPPASELVELSAVEVRRASEPDARDLHRDQVVLLVPEEEVVPACVEEGLSQLVRAVQRYSMSDPLRLVMLNGLACEVERRGVPGDIVECGVCNGGSAAIMSAGIKSPERRVWLYDTFAGLPAPSREDGDLAPKFTGDCQGTVAHVEPRCF